MHATWKILAACLLLGRLAASASSEGFWWGPPEEKSAWSTGTVKVDGYIEDWRGRESDDASGFDFAFSNDAADLYFFISPHTKTGKAQLSGEFGQEVVVWLDPKGDKARTVGVKLGAPERVEDGQPRLIALFGVAGSTSWAEPPEEDRVSVVMGSTLERGALEARIPLRYLGTPVPRRIGVGLTTGAPSRGPAEEARPKRGDSEEGEKREPDSEPSASWSGAAGDVKVGVSGGGGRMRGGEGRGRHGGAGRIGGPHRRESVSAEPLEVWVKVSLARPPKPGP